MKALALTLYNLLLPLVMLLMLPRQWAKMRRRGGYAENWRQRFARYDKSTVDRIAGASWWIHAVSVGEMMMALKLIAALRSSGMWTGPIALTTTTSTGRAVALANADDATLVLWTPLDFPWVARRALAVLRPRQIILVEAEVWPNLLSHAASLRIPVRIVNARLSARSERRYRAFRAVIAPIFGMLDHVCVQDVADRARFVSLGVPDDRITVTGAIKFDDAAESGPPPGQESVQAVLTRFPKLRQRRLVLAASTHPGEESLLAMAWVAVRENHPDTIFVAVPRHFERGAQVVDDLRALGLHPGRRSQPPGPDDLHADCLVVDSTGELRAWLACATVVVMGKCFAGNSGGQNPAEAVAAGKPTIVGPHMDNFLPLVQGLIAAAGVKPVAGEAELPAAIDALLAHPGEAAAMAARGAAVLTAHRGATLRTLAVLAISK